MSVHFFLDSCPTNDGSLRWTDRKRARPHRGCIAMNSSSFVHPTEPWVMKRGLWESSRFPLHPFAAVLCVCLKGRLICFQRGVVPCPSPRRVHPGAPVAAVGSARCVRARAALRPVSSAPFRRNTTNQSKQKGFLRAPLGEDNTRNCFVVYWAGRESGESRHPLGAWESGTSTYDVVKKSINIFIYTYILHLCSLSSPQELLQALKKIYIKRVKLRSLWWQFMLHLVW